MPTLVPQQSQPQELAAQLVAAPVSAIGFAQVMAAQVAFLLGRALPVVAAMSPHELVATGSAVTIPLQWWPSPGCRLALLTVHLHNSLYVNVIGRVVTGSRRATLALTLPTGAGRESSGLAFDGSTVHPTRDPLSAGRSLSQTLIHLGDWGDVTDAIADLSITVDDVGATSHQGIAGITLVEIPVATLRPESGEFGLLQPAFDPRNDINDGDAAIGAGATEILLAEQRASTTTRWHWQIGTYEDTSYAWTRSSSTTGALDWVGSVGTAVDPKFRIRVPAVYGTSASTPATFTLRVRYRTTAKGTLRVVRAVVGSGATSNNDLALDDTSAAWSTKEVSMTLRTDGTDQEIDLQFQASTTDASAIYISSIAVIQTETA